MKSWIVIVIGLFTALSGSGTTIIVVVTEQFVIIAADSQLSNLDPITGSVSYTSGWKIQRPGKVAFSIMGVYGIPGDPAVFYRILSSSFNQNENVDLAIGSANKAISSLIIAELRKKPNQIFLEYDYLKEFLGKLPKYIVVGSDNGTPYAREIDFTFDMDSRQLLQKMTRFEADMKTNMHLIWMGLDEDIWDTNSSPRSFSSVNELVTFMEDLILAQSRKTTTTAPPINILMIDTDGTKTWLKRDTICPE